MKNNLLKYIAFSFLLIGSSSCDNYLEEEPKSTIAPNQFYNSDVEANAGAIGCCFNVAKQFGNRPGHAWDLDYRLHYGTDIARPTGGRDPQYAFHTYTLSIGTEDGEGEMWRTFYRGIADNSNLIERVQLSEGVSEQTKNQIVAEGIVYRAMYYYLYDYPQFFLKNLAGKSYK